MDLNDYKVGDTTVIDGVEVMLMQKCSTLADAKREAQLMVQKLVNEGHTNVEMKEVDSSNCNGKTDNISKSSQPIKKQVSPKKYWIGTLNNWTENEYTAIINIDTSLVPCLIVNKEIGEECGTPHLQIFVGFDEKRRPFSVFECRRISWTGVIINRQRNLSLRAAKEYCSKRLTRQEGTEPYCRGYTPPYVYNMVLRPWQKKIVDLLTTVPNDRTINWFWEANGGIGKTALQKWIVCHCGASLMLAGKSADMKFGICSYIENHDGEVPRNILINVPRDDFNKISYAGIEEIKDGLFFSGKYKGAMCCFASPHILVFANHPPQVERLSAGRWNIVEL